MAKKAKLAQTQGPAPLRIRLNEDTESVDGSMRWCLVKSQEYGKWDVDWFGTYEDALTAAHRDQPTGTLWWITHEIAELRR